MNIGQWIQRQSKAQIILLATSLFLLDEAIDYVTGPELNVSFLHLIPVFLVVWNAGLIPGLVYSVFCTFVIFFISIHSLFTVSIAVQGFNAGANLVFLSAFALVLNYLKKYLDNITYLAEVDGLTELLNARSFWKRAQQEIKISTEKKLPFTLIYIDVDNFKQVNDTMGHGAGDEVLRTIGKFLNSHFRKDDIRTRIGGDEFAVLLPGYSTKEAETEIPKFHQQMNQALGKHHSTVTCSVGAVTFLEAPVSVQTAISEADKLMYQVKMNGKNNYLLRAYPAKD